MPEAEGSLNKALAHLPQDRSDQSYTRQLASLCVHRLPARQSICTCVLCGTYFGDHLALALACVQAYLKYNDYCSVYMIVIMF